MKKEIMKNSYIFFIHPNQNQKEQLRISKPFWDDFWKVFFEPLAGSAVIA